jgi:hypothetical protein
VIHPPAIANSTDSTIRLALPPVSKPYSNTAFHVRHAIVGLAIFLSLWLNLSCASKEQDLKPVEGSEESKDGPTYVVGIIEFVNPEQKFVLIKAQPGIAMPPGHRLIALDATGALSELIISKERKASHITADIHSGNPRVGNLVAYMPKGQSDPASLTAEGQPATTAPAAAPADSLTPPPSPTALVPLSGAGTPYSGPPAVEWREGQPPPFQPTGTAAAPSPSPIPTLTPLPETADSPIPTLPPVIE